MLDSSRRLVIIYLSRRGCRAYTEAVIKNLLDKDPILVIAETNRARFEKLFPGLTIHNLKTTISKWKMLTGYFSYTKNIISLLNKIRVDSGPVQLYHTAFHPWNNHCLNWAQRTDTSSIITIHDFKTHRGERSLLIERLQKQFIRKADLVVFLTEFVKRQAKKQFSNTNNFIVLPHPMIPVDKPNQLKHNKRPRVLFLGRGVGYKGIQLLIDAVEGLDISKLTIAGALSQEINPSDSNVIINKDLSDKEINQLLSEHELLVMPYLEASQSGVIALGTHAEMVMIITKVGGLIEQLPISAALWVKPDITSIRAAIQQLIDKPALYDKIKTEVRKHKQTLS